MSTTYQPTVKRVDGSRTSESKQRTIERRQIRRTHQANGGRF